MTSILNKTNHLLAQIGKLVVPADVPTVDKGNDLIATFMNTATVFGGVFAVAYLIYGGIKYTMSGGEPARIKEANQHITYAIIGLVIVLISFTLFSFVAKLLGLKSLTTADPFNP